MNFYQHLMTGLLIILASVLQIGDTTTMHKTNTHTNRLINATSPYLLQHAHNPVDWYEWGEEALSRAKEEDKPILVSIGYSSCHWCHVMEHESFENEEIAAVMNEHFVCIKVDREERPDIDQIYMDAVQAMGINGGWPLNVFLTPDQKPFYGGTYYPPSSWVQLLNNINKAYGTKRVEIEASADELKDALSQSDLERFKQRSKKTELHEDLNQIYDKMAPQFDTVWGGMDKAPKFIMPSSWLFLLRYYHLAENKEALDQITLTLKRIAMGGIHDQIGGGFSRYSVDAHWFVPHFEKMLYDNAQLLSLYSEAYSVTGDEEFKRVVDDIFTWLQREMTADNGGFYSALDADSEGEEGKFYVWKSDEIKNILGKDTALVEAYYSIQEKGNWEHGNNILIRNKPDKLFLEENKLSPEEWNTILQQARQKLLLARNKRPHPGLDDKIITAWNAMTVSGLADAYRATGKQAYLEAAEKNIAFLESELSDGERLYRSFKGKRSSTVGFLDDYAFLIQAYINLYQVTFKEEYLEKAKSWTDYTLNHFFDPKEEFFFYTDQHGEKLISRKKEIFDNVIPSSNAVMARNLFCLGTILDEEQWKERAENMTASLTKLIVTEPGYMSQWSISLLENKQPMAEVVFMGDDLHKLRADFQRHYYPFAISMGARKESSLPLLEGKFAVDGKTTIYVCFNKACKLPVFTVNDAEAQIGQLSKNP